VEHIDLGVDECPGLEGDSIWVTFHKDGGLVSDHLVEGSGSQTGIARVMLLAMLTQTKKYSPYQDP